MPMTRSSLRLFTAIQQQDLAAVSHALDHANASASVWGPNQTTPLCAAVAAAARDPKDVQGQALGLAIVQRLAHAHPDAVHDRSGNGVTPLDQAVASHRWYLVRWLLDQGARWTASQALVTGHAGAMATDGRADLLIDMVPALNQHNLTVRLGLLEATVAGLTQPTAQDTSAARWTPVWDAWDRLGLPLGSLHPDLHGATSALAALAWQGRPEAVRVLLQHGRDPNGVVDPQVLTPLHLAAQRGHLPVIEVLLAHGADVTRRETVRGETPLGLAQRMNKGATLAAVIARLERAELHGTLGGTNNHDHLVRPRL